MEGAWTRIRSGGVPSRKTWRSAWQGLPGDDSMVMPGFSPLELSDHIFCEFFDIMEGNHVPCGFLAVVVQRGGLCGSRRGSGFCWRFGRLGSTASQEGCRL